MKKIILIVIAIIILGGVGYLIYQSTTGKSSITTPEPKLAVDARNATYIIEGQEVTLVNGRAEKEIAPGSASKSITQYFGNEVKADFNGDSTEDVAFLLSQDNGGSGIFYYVAVALGSKDGYQGTNAIFLGDRIAPQTTEFRNGEIIVNYADRNPGEPMTTQPSLGVSRYFKVSNGKLVEVQKNGFLEGKITIGPLCPVEKIPPDPKCQPTLETYAAWPIAVYSSNQEIKIASIKPDATGLYKVELPVGAYVVNLEKQTPFARSLPKTVVVKEGETTTFNIDIDTGIR